MSAMEDLMSAALSAPEDRKTQALKVLKGEVAATPSPRSEGPLLLGMGAAANYLGCGRTSLWRMIQAGRLEKVEILPGSYRIRRGDLDRYVEENGVRAAGRTELSDVGAGKHATEVREGSGT